SVWSKVNKARIEEMIAEERMAPAGLKAIEIAKANGSWTALDAVEAMIIPNDLANALKRDRIAKKHFDAFPASVRKYTLTWISSARTEATRAKRIAETVSLAARNIRANQPRP
ncbi:MAG: YdeI/OmpD-associated family protein, partial [Flavobacteriales bacterium]|nr:YdeI/OmpD-associated family protein [Flavobacteriales bacterium]